MNDQDTQEKQDVGQETPDSVAISETQDTHPTAPEAESPAEAPAPQAAAEPAEPEHPAEPAEAAPQATEEPVEAAAEKAPESEEKKGFGEILAEFEHDAPKKRDKTAVGGKVSGTILSIGEEWVFVDLGAKSEGRIAAAELKDAEGNLTVKEGDTLEATVTGTDPESGALLLKRKAGGKGKRTEVSAEIKQAFESGLPVEGMVTGLNKGGAEVQVYGMRAFCPLSQLDLRYVEDPQRFVGQKLQFKISRLEEGNRGGRGPNIVLSRRALLEDEQQTKASETREKLQVGATLTGKVTSLTTYGAFVDLGGIEGMLHVSEIGHSRTAHPQDVFQVGQEVEVQVIKIEKGKDEKRPERISLSRRALEKDPWRDAVSRFPEGTETTGKVARTETFGAFVELAPGLEGLVHISEIGGGRRLNHAKEAVQPGQEVQVRVLGSIPRGGASRSPCPPSAAASVVVTAASGASAAGTTGATGETAGIGTTVATTAGTGRSTPPPPPQPPARASARWPTSSRAARRSSEAGAPSGRTLTPPNPLSPSLPPPAGREGATAQAAGSRLFSLFSRRTGGRLGEEGRGDEGLGRGNLAATSVPALPPTALRRRLLPVLLLRIGVEMMQHAMEDRRHQDRGDRDDDEAGVEGVEAGEELAGLGLRRIDRPHAAEQHGGIEEGVDPVQLLEEVIPRHSHDE